MFLSVYLCTYVGMFLNISGTLDLLPLRDRNVQCLPRDHCNVNITNHGNFHFFEAFDQI